MNEIAIWKPVAFDPAWLRVDTSRFDAVMPEWLKQRTFFMQHREQYDAFLARLKRRQAIETGVIEGLYDLTRGATETLVKEGFIESYVGHTDCNRPAGELIEILQDQFDALDMIFAFIKQERPLSTSYIKELHQLLTQRQPTAPGIDIFGNRVPIPLRHGQFKIRPNNPSKDGTVFLYCPPEQVDLEMDKLVALYNTELNDLHVIVKAAWLHLAFVQIHPFQDGNGRMARLLASLVLIQGNLFPFTVERYGRKRYIDALESVDEGDYQALVDIIMDDQLDGIREAQLDLAAITLAKRINKSDIHEKAITANQAKIRQWMNVFADEIVVRMKNFMPPSIVFQIKNAANYTEIMVFKDKTPLCIVDFWPYKRNRENEAVFDTQITTYIKGVGPVRKSLSLSFDYSLFDVQESTKTQIHSTMEHALTKALTIITKDPGLS